MTKENGKDKVKVLLIDGVIWLLQADGSLVIAPEGFSAAEAIVVNPGLTPSSGLGINDPAATIAEIAELLTEAEPVTASQNNTLELAVISHTDITTQLGSITRIGNEVIAESGYETRIVEHAEQAQEEEKVIPADAILPSASIQVSIDDTADRIINRFEAPTVDLSGSTEGIPAGTTIILTISDAYGGRVILRTVDLGGKYEYPNADLSTLQDGILTVSATAVDPYGNTIRANTSAFKDTTALINIEPIGTGSDLVYNAAEVRQGGVSGKVDNIEDGQIVHITLIDANGVHHPSLDVAVTAGRYSTGALDLSSYPDGELRIEVSSIDRAGNPAQATLTAKIDTQAAITVDFDRLGNDRIYNNTEIATAGVSGTVSNIEDGQKVSITFIDSNGVRHAAPDATVTAGQYTTGALDLHTLPDGALRVEVSIVDQAGNPASANSTVQVDTLAIISAQFIDSYIHENIYTDYLNATEIQGTALKGHVVGVENGAAVSITVTDSSNHVLTFNTTVINGLWQIPSSDLSSLTPGTLTLLARTSDAAGNVVTSSPNNTIEYDPLAQLKDDISNVVGTTLNNTSASSSTLTGSVLGTSIEGGRTVYVEISDSNGKIVTGNATINPANGTWTLANINVTSLAEGTLTVTATASDKAGNYSTSQTTLSKDTLASITAEFIDETIHENFGGYYNAAEFPRVDLRGTVANVENGRPVTITITDTAGHTVNVTGVTVLDDGWDAKNVDLHTLVPGNLTLTASTSDLAGNIATSPVQTFIYDPYASITDIAISDTDSNPIISTGEAASVTISGTSSDIEAGRPLKIEVRDESGNVLTFNNATVAADGSWTLGSQDLTSLKDGNLVITSTGTDKAGNIATRNETFIKDTQAALTAHFEDNYNHENAYPGLYNRDEGEPTGSQWANISGKAFGAIDGSQVTLTITSSGGGTITLANAVISGGLWRVDKVDLSSLSPGTLTLPAHLVNDGSGNAADASGTIIYDPNATISNTITHDRGSSVNNIEVGKVTFTGSSSDIEAGRIINVSIDDSDAATAAITGTATVAANGSWVLNNVDLTNLKDGTLNITATGTDRAGNLATGNSTLIKDTQAAITVEFVDALVHEGNYGFLNAIEDDSVSIRGTTTQIEDGQVVNLVIKDQSGHTVTASATVVAGAYIATGINLSGLDENTLTVIASTSDLAGNLASASNGIIHDTLADITNLITSNQGPILNAAEIASKVSFTGTSSNIEAGRVVNVTISDQDSGTANIDTTATIGSDGKWVLSNTDLSTLSDGQLTITANASDKAGNVNAGSATFIKDTQAAITVQFTNHGGDQIYNNTEVHAVIVRGTVSNVEDGQKVSIVLSNSAGQTLTLPDVVVAGGVWQIPNPVDLSSFNGGSVYADAKVYDVAGNPASARSTALIDKDVQIDIVTDTTFGALGDQGIGVAAFRTSGTYALHGTVKGAEIGSTVVVSLTDGVTTKTFNATVNLTGNANGDGMWNTIVDTSGLVNPNAWTIKADVVDPAGNKATDTTPTIIWPEFANLSEDAMAMFGKDTDIAKIRVEGADSFRFTHSQEVLSTLTSEGYGVTITVASDGQSITVTRNSTGNPEVLKFSLLADQTIRTTLWKPVDQADNRDTLLTIVSVAATQHDGDGTSETVIASMPIVISDSVPFSQPDFATMIEGKIGSGNVLSNDITSEKPFTIEIINIGGTINAEGLVVGGTNYTVTAGAPTVITFPQGILTILQNGDWAFDAHSNLNHATAQKINFNYVARDADGDISTSPVTIDIIDGAAGVVPHGAGTFTELIVGTPLLQGLDFTITAGSDHLDSSTIRFDNAGGALLTSLDALNLSSLGIELVWTLSSDNKLLIAKAGASGPVVLEMSLTASSDANGNLLASAVGELLRPLDHPKNNTLVMDISVTASDIDGTAAQTGHFALTIMDGTDPNIASTAGVNLSENSFGPGPGIPPIVGTGNLAVTVGSDDIASVKFASASNQPKLRSMGYDLVYTLSADGRTITAHRAGMLIDPVMVIELKGTLNSEANSTQNYVVTLFKPLDQINAIGQHIDILNIPIKVRVNDSDGDSKTISLDINVSDSSNPPTGPTPVVLDVAEAPQKTGSGLTESDQGVMHITSSQDSIVALRYVIVNGAAVVDSFGHALTQNGNAIIWQDRGNGTLDAVSSKGNIVFTVTVPASVVVQPNSSLDVSVSLLLKGPIDHLNSGAAVDLLTVNLPVQLVDSDGSTQNGAVVLHINDGADPKLLTSPILQVSEHDLLSSSPISDVDQVIGIYGSDKITSTLLTLQNVGITSGGLTVTLANSPDANGWWIAKDSNNQEVFRLKTTLDGALTYQQTRALDHAAGNGMNTFSLVFDVKAVDADKDQSNSGTITVIITDDVPTAMHFDHVVTEGEDLSGNFLKSASSQGADGATITVVHYAGLDYVIPPGSSTSFNMTVDILSVSYVYGVATVYSDGRYSFDVISTFNFNGTNVTDTKLSFDVTDKDGDTVTNTLTLTVQDADGTITIAPISGLEDTAITVNLQVDPGDVDQGEKVTQVAFDPAKLLGGTLYLNGVALSIVGGKPVLTEAQLIQSGAVYIPNGTLTFVPALNSSQATIHPSIDATATISTHTGVKTITDIEAVIVTSVVDAPSWHPSSQFNYTSSEDAAPIALNLGAQLYDTDGSEKLSYRISSIETGLTLKVGSLTVTNGMTLSEAQVSQLTASASSGLAGRLSFDLTAIATEQDVGTTSEIVHTINIDVTPVADTPTVLVQDVRGTEDVAIDAKTLFGGSLTDTDGSETLSFDIAVPTGWQVIGINGGLVTSPSAGHYRVSAADVSAGRIQLQPAEDISSNDIPGKKFAVTITAIATESTQDGLVPNPSTASSSKTAYIELTGVADSPFITDGASHSGWVFNAGAKTVTGTFLEDTRVALDFIVKTQDNQNTESINLLLSGVPAGAHLVDAAGNPINLPIVGNINGQPVYQVSAADLHLVYFQPPKDFSGGALSLDVRQISTEPDGNVNTTDMQIKLNFTPVDDTISGQNIESVGSEDIPITLNLMPDLKDDDGSETVTAFTINSAGVGLLFYKGVLVSVPPGGLDLAAFASSHGTTLSQLLVSGNLAWQGTEDAAGTFLLPVTYTVTDTSSTGVTVTETFNGQLQVKAEAQVDINGADFPGFTRLDNTTPLLVSTTGAPISLTNQIKFTEDDIDGSETLDYIVIKAPNNQGFFISHPLGAVHDGLGNWLIPIPPGFTSSSVVELAKSILDGATISSNNVGLFDFTISARALDGSDAEMIGLTQHVRFDAASSTGTAQLIGTLQTSTADGFEASASIDLSQHINQNVAGDANDIISFRVMAADLPEGAGLAGTGMRYHYDSSGKNIIEYVFTSATLTNLSLVGVQEDFAGVYTFPIHKVSTDPSGATVESLETMRVEIAPVVDQIDAITGMTIKEDTPSALTINLSKIIDDDSILNSKGVERVTGIHFLAMTDGGHLSAPAGLLVSDGSGGYTITDVSRLGEVLYTPPFNKHGTFNIPLELTVTDTTTGNIIVSNTANHTFTSNIAIVVEQITDVSTLNTQTITGAEDDLFALTGLSAALYDTDGSESMTLQISGLPKDAVLYIDRGGNLVAAANNGSKDGGLTYSWGFNLADIGHLVLRPPLNYSGDMALTLNAVTVEIGTNDVRTTSSAFTVAVSPIADGVQLQNYVASYTASEGQAIELTLNSTLRELPDANNVVGVNSDESQLVTIRALTTSDLSALQGLANISHSSGIKSSFVRQVDGSYLATMQLSQTVLHGPLLTNLLLDAGSSAFGHLKLEVTVQTIDTNTILGASSSNTSSPQVVTMDIDITAKPDAAELTLGYEHFSSARDISSIPLHLNLHAINPAPGEVQQLLVQGLPTGFTLNHGTLSGNTWTVAAADVPSLAITGYGTSNQFDLSLETRSTLNGASDTGSTQIIHVELSPAGAGNIANASGDGLLSGGTGADRFVFQQSEMGSILHPTHDAISDFNKSDGDQLDLVNVAASKPHANGADLDSIIDVIEASGTTTFKIKLDGTHVTQEISMQGVTMDSLYGGSVSGVSEAAFLQKLIDDHVLVQQ